MQLLTFEGRKAGFKWMLVGGGAVTGQAGSIDLTLTSRAYSFLGGNTSDHVCRSLNMAARVFSST